MKYTNYQVQDFVADANFQRWVLVPDAATAEFWETWLRQNPLKKPEVEEAQEIIKVLGFTTDFKANADFLAIWQQIQDNLPADTAPTGSGAARNNAGWFNPYQQFAAAFIGLLMVLGIIWYLQPTASSRIQYATTYGQLKTITLPDGSEVFLNANSTLAFNSDWPATEPRHVWLTGEAYFKVVKQNNPTGGKIKFKVHTSQAVVEVLGTQFNVNNRRKNTQVVLKSGAIKLNVHAPVPASVLMQPGDLVRYSKVDNQLIRKKVDPRYYTSWLNKELVFDKTTLQEIAWLLEDNYGYVVTFQETALARKKFTGTIPNNNINLLLTALTKLYNLQIIRNQNNLLFAANNPDM